MPPVPPAPPSGPPSGIGPPVLDELPLGKPLELDVVPPGLTGRGRSSSEQPYTIAVDATSVVSIQVLFVLPNFIAARPFDDDYHLPSRACEQHPHANAHDTGIARAHLQDTQSLPDKALLLLALQRWHRWPRSRTAYLWACGFSWRVVVRAPLPCPHLDPNHHRSCKPPLHRHLLLQHKVFATWRKIWIRSLHRHFFARRARCRVNTSRRRSTCWQTRSCMDALQARSRIAA